MSRERNAPLFQRFGLHPQRDLGKECADFYVLERLSADGWRAAMPRLQVLEVSLSKEFAKYLDMAVGGELRHANTMSRECGLILPFHLLPFLERCSEADDSRKYAWKLWVQMRRDNPEGTLLWLREAASLFVDQNWGNEDESPGVGGPGWSTAARLVYDYYTHAIKPRAFVDRCFTLQHNNNYIFDKTYDVDSLRISLVLQANNDYASLARRASGETRRMYAKWRASLRREYSAEWLGIQDTERTE